MPQLDTVYALTTYLWTWFMLHMMTQKIKMFMMTKTPTINLAHNKMTPTPSWL